MVALTSLATVRAPDVPAPPAGIGLAAATGGTGIRFATRGTGIRFATREEAQAPAIDAAALVPPGSRAVLVAPHPDDEILALGATLSALHDAGRVVRIVAVTDGDASHPGSAAWPPERLRTVRPAETAEALRRLGLDPNAVARLGLPDGGVTGREQDLAHRLAGLLQPGDVVCVPWRHDGHPDHEACARAALAATRAAGLRCIEFPVWSRVPVHPAHAGLRDVPLHRIRVPVDLQVAKAHAVQAFRSQLDDDGDTAAVLQPQALRTWLDADEWVIAP